jgi:hypothetical protein
VWLQPPLLGDARIQRDGSTARPLYDRVATNSGLIRYETALEHLAAGYEDTVRWGTCATTANRVAAHTIGGMATPIPPFRVIEDLKAAHWSGDPQQMREAIWNAKVAGVRTWQIAEELGTTTRRVRAAIIFPTA